jgi:hypothetical protein
VAHQIRALHDVLESEEGRLHLLPSHDPTTLAELQRSGVIGEGLALR